MRRIKRHMIAKRECVIIKYLFDTRYSEDLMATHDKQMIKALPCKKIEDVRTMLDEYEIIGIDEGQFFSDVCYLFDCSPL